MNSAADVMLFIIGQAKLVASPVAACITWEETSRRSSNHHYVTLHKIWNFPLRISSVNVSKSSRNCRFSHIYWRNPWWKTLFFVQCQHTKARKTQETVSFQQKFNNHAIFLIYLAFTFLFSQKTKTNEVNEQMFFIQSSSYSLMFFKIDYL